MPGSDDLPTESSSSVPADGTTFDHIPVMLTDVIERITTVPDGLWVDGTLGGAGHAVAVLDSNDGLRLHGFDRDPMAIDAASKRLSRFGERAQVTRTRFDSISSVLRESDISEISGFLLDLGVSSPQLDLPERGFSYHEAGPLDMRMDPDDNLTASDVVNGYPAGELRDVLRSYGDERHAARIVDAIIAARPITTTDALAAIVADATPAAARRKPGHPARRTFQAIRIEVNAELSILAGTIESLIDMLAVGGVGFVLTYHSGEDRTTKTVMRTMVEDGVLPGIPNPRGLEWAWRGAQKPAAREIEANPRSRSARLRGITRFAPAQVN